MVSGLTLAALAVVALFSGVVPGVVERSARPQFPPPPSVPFHVQPAVSPFYEEPFCHGCHPSPPHRRSEASRAMLNHHATAVHCLVCHGRNLGEAELDLGISEGVLWPRVEGRRVDRAAAEAWRLRVTEKSPCFGPGPGCGACHRAGGIIAFPEAGYEPERVKRLTSLEEFLLLPLRERWFFPGSF